MALSYPLKCTSKMSTSFLLFALTLESQITVPLVIKVPQPQIWIVVLFGYPNKVPKP